LNTFAEQSDTITHVALVKPKSGVFIDEIQHLLVICTPVSVLLLGVQEVPGIGSNGRQRKELKVYATGMSVPTDVQMASVVGTIDGRIFMCGTQDGNLYELHYQEREGWFGKRIQLINHSVGGVSSLLPMFSSSSASGELVTICSG
jgi:nuclear pore complex protein Nup155